MLKNNNDPVTLKETWQWENTKERFSEQLGRWDKKLSKLNDELLYYIIMRAESILNSRAERERQHEVSK